ETLSPIGDLVEAAAAFYAALRRLDALGLPRLAAVRFPNRGLGAALNDRLRRAAAS
ncbi:MAG: Sua5 family C-terminal domain-containing protein, partial [Planctomycetota bacterium]